MYARHFAGFAVAMLLATAASAQSTDPQTAQTARYDTQDGELVVHSGQPGPRSYGPPPPFAELAHGKAFITEADAAGYALLANDFIYADSNRDGRISESEYARWTRAPR